MAELWKWSSSRLVAHMEDNKDSSIFVPPNDLTLIGTSTVPGKLDNAQSFDFINDRISIQGLPVALANDTEGTIVSWLTPDADTGTIQWVFTAARGVDAILTQIIIGINWTDNNIFASCRKDGQIQWQINTPVGSMTPFIGSFVPIIFKHDSTKLSEIIVNNIPQVITRPIQANNSVWFKGIYTDAANPADNLNLGAVFTNGIPSGFFGGALDEVGIFGEVWDSIDDNAYWNGGVGQIMTAPEPPPSEPTPLFLRMFEHLLPNAKAWRI